MKAPNKEPLVRENACRTHPPLPPPLPVTPPPPSLPSSHPDISPSERGGEGGWGSGEVGGRCGVERWEVGEVGWRGGRALVLFQMLRFGSVQERAVRYDTRSKYC